MVLQRVLPVVAGQSGGYGGADDGKGNVARPLVAGDSGTGGAGGAGGTDGTGGKARQVLTVRQPEATGNRPAVAAAPGGTSGNSGVGGLGVRPPPVTRAGLHWLPTVTAASAVTAAVVKLSADDASGTGRPAVKAGGAVVTLARVALRAPAESAERPGNAGTAGDGGQGAAAVAPVPMPEPTATNPDTPRRRYGGDGGAGGAGGNAGAGGSPTATVVSAGNGADGGNGGTSGTAVGAGAIGRDGGAGGNFRWQYRCRRCCWQRCRGASGATVLTAPWR